MIYTKRLLSDFQRSSVECLGFGVLALGFQDTSHIVETCESVRVLMVMINGFAMLEHEPAEGFGFGKFFELDEYGCDVACARKG